MLSKRTMRFPKLRWAKSVQLETKGKSIERPLYRLDWTNVDKIRKDDECEIDFSDINGYTKTKGDKYNAFEVLPKKYLDICDNYLFCISNDYMKAIRFHAKSASDQWAYPMGFHGTFKNREIIVNTHIDIAITLLADCVWSESKNFYARSEDVAEIGKPLLLYRTLRVQDKADNNNPRKTAKLSELVDGLHVSDMIIDFVSDIEKFEYSET